MNPLVLLFMAIVTFLLAVIAYVALLPLELLDPGLASNLKIGVAVAGIVGVVVFLVGAASVGSSGGGPTE